MSILQVVFNFAGEVAGLIFFNSQFDSVRKCEKDFPTPLPSCHMKTHFEEREREIDPEISVN